MRSAGRDDHLLTGSCIALGAAHAEARRSPAHLELLLLLRVDVLGCNERSGVRKNSMRRKSPFVSAAVSRKTARSPVRPGYRSRCPVRRRGAAGG